MSVVEKGEEGRGRNTEVTGSKITFSCWVECGIPSGWDGGGGLGFLEEEGLMKGPKKSSQQTSWTPGEHGAQKWGTWASEEDVITYSACSWGPEEARAELGLCLC